MARDWLARRWDGARDMRRRPVYAAVAAIGVVVATSTVLLSINADNGGPDRRSLALPWWGDDYGDEATPSPSPSEAYLLVGPASPPPGAGRPVAGKPKPATPPRKKPGYTAVTGVGCGQDASRTYDQSVPYYGGQDPRGGYQDPYGGYNDPYGGGYYDPYGGRDGHRSGGRGGAAAGPNDRTAGGWTGDGCRGGYTSMELTRQTWSTGFAVWAFRPAALKQGSCAVSIYVPKPQVSGDVTARDARYAVQLGDGSSVSFGVNQAAKRGSWYAAGSYPLRNGQISVRLTNAGGGSGERAAAAQAKVVCA